MLMKQPIVADRPEYELYQTMFNFTYLTTGVVYTFSYLIQ